jgi:hypothetical protein
VFGFGAIPEVEVAAGLRLLRAAIDVDKAALVTE